MTILYLNLGIFLAYITYAMKTRATTRALKEKRQMAKNMKELEPYIFSMDNCTDENPEKKYKIYLFIQFIYLFQKYTGHILLNCIYTM